MAITSTSFPANAPIVQLDFDDTTRIWVLRMLAAETPDNRLTHHLILDGILPALSHVETWWQNLTNKQGGAALITTGAVDAKAKIFSNGLDLPKALADPHFFDNVLNEMLLKYLTFPIPCIASIGGHAFAGGFGMVAANDYRVMNGARGFLCMNEIEFGAQVPHGLQQAVASKIVDMNTMRKVILEGHRFTAAEGHKLGFVDAVAKGEGYEGAAGTLKLAHELANKVKSKASMDVWGGNKRVIYASSIKVLRTKNYVATAKL